MRAWSIAMADLSNAAELRRLAIACAARASETDCETAERIRLLTMRESLLALANEADWLAGKHAAIGSSLQILAE
jgi:hypothetical protein